MNKKFIFLAGFVFLLVTGLLIYGCGRKEKSPRGGGSEEIAYWTCAMHPSVKISPQEYNSGRKNCPICGMDLIQVKKSVGKKEPAEPLAMSQEPASEVKVKITPREIQLAGVRTARVDYRHLFKEIITVGKVAYDPELVVAEEEYLAALSGYEKIAAGGNPDAAEQSKRLLGQAEYRLKLLGLNETMIAELNKNRRPHKNLLLPEERAWIYADVYEYELSSVRIGQKIEAEATAYPGEIYSGRIISINPTLDSMTRAVRIRAEVENPSRKLKPEMYVQVRIVNHLGHQLAVPKDAVLDTGRRQIVYVDNGDGEYLAKEVRVGELAEVEFNGRREKFYIVKSGLKPGDIVVTKANFLIDSQSQITGAASSAYGGALETKSDLPSAMPPGHQH